MNSHAARRQIVAVTVVAGMCVGGCGVRLESSSRSVSVDEIPAGLLPVDPVASSVPTQQETIDVWFVRESLLASARHRVAAPVDASVALAELLAGPNDTDLDRSFRSAIPDASAVVAVSVSGGIATVQLAPFFAEIPASDQVLAIGQMVLTMTDLRGIGRVRFILEDPDTALPVPLPSGETAPESVSRDDYLILTTAG